MITEELKYLTWDEAYLCLTNEQLPDQLRAKYCSLIIGESYNISVIKNAVKLLAFNVSLLVIHT